MFVTYISIGIKVNIGRRASIDVISSVHALCIIETTFNLLLHRIYDAINCYMMLFAIWKVISNERLCNFKMR